MSGQDPNNAQPQIGQIPQIPENFELPIGVYPDGKAWFVNQTTQESLERDSGEVLDLIKSPDTMNEIKGRLFAIYIAQKLAETADKSLIIDDDVGNPVHIEMGRAGFTFLAEKPEISDAMKAAIDLVEEEVKTTPELAAAKGQFLNLCAQMQQMQMLRSPIEFLFKQTCFNWLSKQEITDFVTEIKAEEQSDATADQIARLEKGVAMLDNFAELMQKAQAEQQARAEAQKAQQETIVYRPLGINANGTVTLSNVKTKEETTVDANGLLDIVRRPEKIDILALFTSYVALKIYEESAKSTLATGDVLSVHQPVKNRTIQAEIDGKPQTFTFPQLHTEVEAEFSLLTKDAYAKATGASGQEKIDAIIATLKKEMKDDTQITAAANGFTDFLTAYKEMFSLPAEIKYMLTIKRDEAAIDDLKASAPDGTPEAAAIAGVRQQMDVLKAEAQEKIAARDQRNAESKVFSDAILARGKNTDAANATWKTIRTLPEEQQFAAALKAFSPTAAAILGDATPDNRGKGFTDIAITKWRADQNAKLEESLGTLTRHERALANALLNATEQAVKHAILIETAANDPWVETRKDRLSFQKDVSDVDRVIGITDNAIYNWTKIYGQEKPVRLDQLSQAGSRWMSDSAANIMSESMLQSAQKTLASWTGSAKAGVASIFKGNTSATNADREVARAVTSGIFIKLAIDDARLDKLVSIATDIGVHGPIMKTGNDLIEEYTPVEKLVAAKAQAAAKAAAPAPKNA